MRRIRKLTGHEIKPKKPYKTNYARVEKSRNLSHFSVKLRNLTITLEFFFPERVSRLPDFTVANVFTKCHSDGLNSITATRVAVSDHQWLQEVHLEVAFTLRKRVSISSSWVKRLRISDRKFAKHTTEMILWSMILTFLDFFKVSRELKVFTIIELKY